MYSVVSIITGFKLILSGAVSEITEYLQKQIRSNISFVSQKILQAVMCVALSKYDTN